MDRLLPLLQSKRIDAVPTIVASHEEFLAASLEDKTISFVTDDRLQKLEGLELAHQHPAEAAGRVDPVV